jgi:HEAT repeat protein
LFSAYDTGIMRRTAILLLIVAAACKPSVTKLREALKDKDVKVRRAAVVDLGHRGDAAVVDDLLAAATDSQLRKDALDAIKALGPAAAPRLMEHAKSADAKRRSDAWLCLANIKHRDAVPLLIERLGDPNLAIAKEAAETLGRIGDARAQEPLLAILNRKIDPRTEGSPEDSLQSAAGAAAGKLGSGAVPALLTALDSKDPYVRSYAALGLAEARDERAIPAVIRHLGDEYDNCPSLGYNLGQALVKIGPKGVDAAINASKKGDERTRDNVVNALGNCDDPRCMPALLEMLRDESTSVRSSIGFYLAYKPLDARSQQFLADALKKKEYLVIAGAMPYFVEKGFAGSEPVLLEALEKNGDSNLTAVGVLLNSGNPQLEAGARKWAERHGYEVKKETSENAIHQHWGAAR